MHGEGILANGPSLRLFGCRRCCVKFAVIEDSFEQPVGTFNEIFARLSRRAVTVFDALEIALGELIACESVLFLLG